MITMIIPQKDIMMTTMMFVVVVVDDEDGDDDDGGGGGGLGRYGSVNRTFHIFFFFEL